MRIPFYLKSTFFASILILVLMTITLFWVGSTIVDRIQSEQRVYAEAQAENLAEKIADILPVDDYSTVIARVEIFSSARITKRKKDRIRVWDIDGLEFYKRIDTSKESADELADEVKKAVLNGQEIKIEDEDLNVYRVIVPIKVENKIVGAVEFTQELDTLFSEWERYWKKIIGLALLFVIFTILIFYFRSKIAIQRPLNEITDTLKRAKAGELDARTKVRGRDEFASVAEELNRMLGEIEVFTKIEQAEKETLAEKVKEATAEIRKRNKQLEKANKEIWQTTKRLSESEKLAAAGQAAAQFAHEVGTPLNLISGHVQLLQRQMGNDEAAKKRLDVIGSQIERIEKIVHTMLDKTRFGEVEHKHLDLNRLLEDVLEIVSPALETDNIEVIHKPAENLPHIKGNTEHLQQVLFNLINNANDAMPDEGTLHITTREEDSKIILEIADSGGGMDRELQKKIFDPLFTTKKAGQGTGLGLAIVKQILSEHNAEIKVESEKGVGTKFLLIFPKPEKV